MAVLGELPTVILRRGAMLTLRLRPGQVRTLANGLGGIVAAME